MKKWDKGKRMEQHKSVIHQRPALLHLMSILHATVQGSYGLYSHLRTHHNFRVDWSSAPISSFSCPNCRYAFKTACGLYSYLLTHPRSVLTGAELYLLSALSFVDVKPWYHEVLVIIDYWQGALLCNTLLDNCDIYHGYVLWDTQLHFYLFDWKNNVLMKKMSFFNTKKKKTLIVVNVTSY